MPKRAPVLQGKSSLCRSEKLPAEPCISPRLGRQPLSPVVFVQFFSAFGKRVKNYQTAHGLSGGRRWLSVLVSVP